MIKQEESGLPASEYSSLAGKDTGATYKVTLQRINFAFTLQAGEATDALFDACVSRRSILRVVIQGSTLTIQRSISGSDWANLHTISGGLPFCIFADDDTVRVWYCESDTIKYVESPDEGNTWGTAQTVGSLADVTHLAATSLTKLHAVTYDGYNSRLHYYTGTTLTSSKIYFPAEFSGFDAE